MQFLRAYLKCCGAAHGASAQVGGVALVVRLIMRVLDVLLVNGAFMLILDRENVSMRSIP